MAAASSKVSIAFHWKGHQSRDSGNVSVSSVALKTKNSAEPIIVRINDGIASNEAALPFTISQAGGLPGREVKQDRLMLPLELIQDMELSAAVLRLTADPYRRTPSGMRYLREDLQVTLTLPKGGLRPEGKYHILFTSDQTLEFRAELIEEVEKSYEDYFKRHAGMILNAAGRVEAQAVVEADMKNLTDELSDLPEEKLGALCNVAFQAYQSCKQAKSLEEIMKLPIHQSLVMSLTSMATINFTIAELQGKLTIKLDPNQKPTFFQKLQIMVRHFMSEIKDRKNPQVLVETTVAKVLDIFYNSPNGAETIERVVEKFLQENGAQNAAPKAAAAAPIK